MKKLNTYLNLAKILIVGILFLGLVTSSYSCNKEKKNPPRKDIFRCEIDGVPWEAGCESNNIAWGCIAIDCQYYEDSGGFELGASNTSQDNGISLRKSSSSGGLVLGSNNLSRATYGLNQAGISYNMNPESLGNIELISIDTIKKLIECNFSFKAYSTGGDSVVISNGYFKVKYRP